MTARLRLAILFLVVTAFGGKPLFASEIDNCCFVNRQCVTDQEWIDGYHAYQRNECPARTTGAQPTSPQSVSGAPAGIDNCCFAGWQCNTDEEWRNGYHAYQNNQCAVPSQSAPAAQTRPRIEGSPGFVRFIESTLDLLERHSTRWYRYVVDQTNLIVEGDPLDPDSCGARVNVSARRVTVQSDCQTWRTGHMAQILAHEACHVYHYDNGITYPEGKLREEWECGKPSIEVLIALGFTGVYQSPWDEFFAWTKANNRS